MTLRASVKLAMLLLAAILVLSFVGVPRIGEWSLLMFIDDGRCSDEQEIAQCLRAEFPGIEHVPFPTQSGVIAFRKP